MSKVTILGDGGWGTALALILARKEHETVLWGVFPNYLAEIRRRRENIKFLPGVKLPERITIVSDPEQALAGAEFVILAVPSQHLRQVCVRIKPFLPDEAVVISGTKGLEISTMKRMSEVIVEVIPSSSPAVISGPSHAEEVARGQPTTVVAAAPSPEIARRCQELLMEERFRIYTHADVVGVELGGALKNVISIAAGISDGLGFGDNTKAALLTRGMVEIVRLGVTLGAQQRTFWGLSGIGDLITSAFSPYGRNLKFGRLIGEGASPAAALAATEMVVEGYRTSSAAYRLSLRQEVDMPIVREIYRVLHENKPSLQAVHELMTRDPKDEIAY